MEVPKDPSEEQREVPEPTEGSISNEKKEKNISSLVRTAIAKLKLTMGALRAELLADKDGDALNMLYYEVIACAALSRRLETEDEKLHIALLKHLLPALRLLATTIVEDEKMGMEDPTLLTHQEMIYTKDAAEAFEIGLVPLLYRFNLPDLAFKVTGAITQMKLNIWFGDEKKEGDDKNESPKEKDEDEEVNEAEDKEILAELEKQDKITTAQRKLTIQTKETIKEIEKRVAEFSLPENQTTASYKELYKLAFLSYEELYHELKNKDEDHLAADLRDCLVMAYMRIVPHIIQNISLIATWIGSKKDTPKDGYIDLATQQVKNYRRVIIPLLIDLNLPALVTNLLDTIQEMEQVLYQRGGSNTESPRMLREPIVQRLKIEKQRIIDQFRAPLNRLESELSNDATDLEDIFEVNTLIEVSHAGLLDRLASLKDQFLYYDLSARLKAAELILDQHLLRILKKVTCKRREGELPTKGVVARLRKVCHETARRLGQKKFNMNVIQELETFANALEYMESYAPSKEDKKKK